MNGDDHRALCLRIMADLSSLLPGQWHNQHQFLVPCRQHGWLQASSVGGLAVPSHWFSIGTPADTIPASQGLRAQEASAFTASLLLSFQRAPAFTIGLLVAPLIHSAPQPNLLVTPETCAALYPCLLVPLSLSQRWGFLKCKGCSSKYLVIGWRFRFNAIGFL